MEALHKAIEGLQKVTARELSEAPSFKHVLNIFHFKQTGKPLDTDCIICLSDAFRNFRKFSREEIISIFTKKEVMNEQTNRIFKLKGTRGFNWKAQNGPVRFNNDNLTDQVAEEWINHSAKVLQNFELTPMAFEMAFEMGIKKEDLIFWGLRTQLSKEDVEGMIANLNKKKQQPQAEQPEASSEDPQQPPQASKTPTPTRKAAKKK
jgi:hypothetical protein